jgi:hypothetical protein
MPSFARVLGGTMAVAVALLAGEARAQGVPPPLPQPAPLVLPPPPDPVFLDLGLRVGGALRIGSSSSVPVATRNGGMMGIAASIAPSRRISIGVSYEHAGIGTERGTGDASSADIARSLDEIFATLRLAFFDDGVASFGFLVGPGLAWQHAHVDGVLFGATPAASTPFSCTENGGPDVGVRLGVGTQVKLGRRFVLGIDAVFDALHLSSDPLGTCIPGAGSMVVFGGRATAAYRFDVSRGVR